jgi:UDP-glucose 4-epimerase
VGIQQNIWDRYRNVIGIWIRNLLNGDPLLIYGDGLQTRAFSDIKYYMEPFYRLMNVCDEEIIHLGSDTEWRLVDVANIILEIAKNKYGIVGSINHVDARHEVKHAYCSHEKAKKILNFRDETDLYQTIDEMISWAIKQPSREVKSINYELSKDIYSYWA